MMNCCSCLFGQDKLDLGALGVADVDLALLERLGPLDDVRHVLARKEGKAGLDTSDYLYHSDQGIIYDDEAVDDHDVAPPMIIKRLSAVSVCM